MVKMNRVLIIGGGLEGAMWAKNCGAIHVDKYKEIDPDIVDGGLQIHLENFEILPYIFEEVDVVYVYLDVLESVENLPWEVIVVAPSTSPICSKYRCVERPCLSP
ncbi:MAG: hypothetical protein QXT46_05200 [Pyrobaculum sp.]